MTVSERERETWQEPAAERRERRTAAVRRFRPSLLSGLQARRIRLWLRLVAFRLLRFQIEATGLEHIPAGEPLIIAAAPHRNWIDSFLLLLALPPLPRIYFIAAAENTQNRWWKRLALALAGGMVPVSTAGGSNRAGLEISLAILEAGNRIGIFAEGWDATQKPPGEVQPLKRGVAFLSEHSGRRVLPVALAGTQELWRGKTLRMHVAPPLAALAAGSDRAAEQAYVDRLREVLQEAQPPLPPEPSSGKKPWRWLTRFL